MVKPVSLSDPAFAALRREKKDGESDSDVVLRLVREAHRARKDPMSFVRGKPHRRMMDPAAHQRWIAEMRDASTFYPGER